MLLTANILGLIITWIVWLWLATQDIDAATSLLIAVLGIVSLIPIIFAGRWLLDRQPSVPHAIRVTTVIHFLLAILLGSAVLAATRFAQYWDSWLILLPTWPGLIIMGISGAMLVWVVFTLVFKGLGSPFALTLTRVLVSDWIYAWTRNPLILSALAFLVGLGLWLRSALFLIWVLAVVSPVILMFLTVYEERELEIRFGDHYLDYKTRIPRLFPRKPRNGT